MAKNLVKRGKTSVALIGSGNIATDLMLKIQRRSSVLSLTMMAGIDPRSTGLQLARENGVVVTSDGLDGLLGCLEFGDVDIIFDATSAAAHVKHAARLQGHNKVLIDLTPAAIGPFVVPVVNLDSHLNAANINMTTCGGQATIPIVAAIRRVVPVLYAEIVASIASKSAGPGTRANIDEFTQTTSRAIRDVGGAENGKAIIILNPAEPPLMMRDTVFCLCEAHGGQDVREKISQSVESMVANVQEYVPGYRLKQAVQFEQVGHNQPLYLPDLDRNFTGLKVSVFLEVEGAGDFLPKYAGNLDIMTSAALRTAEELAYRTLAGDQA